MQMCDRLHDLLPVFKDCKGKLPFLSETAGQGGHSIRVQPANLLQAGRIEYARCNA